MDRDLIDSFEINFKSAFRNLKFAILLGALLFALCVSAEAQQPEKLRKIGFLEPVGVAAANIEAFRQGLRELGYIDGRNIVVEYRSGEDRERLAELATELVRQKVDLMVAVGPAVPAAKMATGTVPIVFLFSGDPIEAGLIDSLAHPGRNMTGITWLAFELVGKRLEILREVVPKVSRVAVLASPAHPGEQRELRETQSTARALGITLQYNQVRGTADVQVAFDKIVKDNANALLIFPDPVTHAHRKQIAEFAAKRRLPSMFGRKEPVEDGGLISYGPKLEEVYRRIPVHVDKILKGAKPADLPTELPTKFEFVINLNTAKQIGLTIPPNVLARADKVIR
jgi:putative ABC transport system substrate-binding protein